jgi:DNA-binding CsgD family transcriptional regulator
VVVGVDGAGRTHRLDAIAAAADLPVVRLDASATVPETLRERLETAAEKRGSVFIDDAHRLPVSALQMLTAAARSGQSMVLARRPTIDRPELAELDEAVAAGGGVDVLAPLDFEQTRALIAAVTGGPCSAETAQTVLAASGGLPAIAVMLATVSGAGAAAGPPPMLAARLQRRMAMLAPQQAHTARLLALRLQISDDALALACGLDPPGLEAALQVLRDNGMLVAGTEQMIPAVADTLLAGLAGGQRRRLHDDVARALVATGAAPSAAATQLRAARARGVAAAAAYLAAGEDLRFTDPAAAVGWFDDAADAGALDAAVAPGRAEAGVLLGMPDNPDAIGLTERDTARLSLVAGAVAAHQGRADRAVAALLTAPPPGPEMAVLALVATGQLEVAQKVDSDAGDKAPAGLRLLAETALACPDPATALPLAIEAAEALERTAPSHLLLDTPHALGAVLAVLNGDVSTAGHLLERALKHGVGGPVFADRHRLLLAWARMRAGRLDAAHEQVARLAGAELGGRDRVLFAALSAGLARRAGDIASLRETWPAVERVLARRGLDLFQIEVAEELAVAAARLRRSPRMAPTMASFEAILAGLGSPPAWVIGFGWLQLQVAVAADDPGAARSAADRIAAAPAGTAGERQSAQQVAAAAWAAALAGDVDPDLVIAACDRLAAVELPWEASRLAGDAAIRVCGAAPARRLLERARELAAPAVRAVDPAQQAGLSEREIEVARQVLAGRTHREIGAQLFIAPKTVEHHVARIRTKLGATTRADFFSTLQSLFGAAADPP